MNWDEPNLTQSASAQTSPTSAPMIFLLARQPRKHVSCDAQRDPSSFAFDQSHVRELQQIIAVVAVMHGTQLHTCMHPCSSHAIIIRFKSEFKSVSYKITYHEQIFHIKNITFVFQRKEGDGTYNELVNIIMQVTTGL